MVCGHGLVTLFLTINETLKWLSSLSHLNAGHSGGDSVAIGIYSTSTSSFSPSLISLMVSVDVKHYVYFTSFGNMVQDSPASLGAGSIKKSRITL